MKDSVLRNPNLFAGGLSTKSNLITGAQIPNTRVNILDLASASFFVLRKFPELSAGCVAIVKGKN
jgi:hypothetical protein